MYSGQPSTGVELRKKMNDDFQDFIDFVDPIIKNPLASNEGKPHLEARFITTAPSPVHI